MSTSYKIKKVITNNIIQALDINDHEVILIGKGIGFGKKSKDLISSYNVDNTFILKNEQETNLYKRLLTTSSPRLIEISQDVITYIQSCTDKPLNEHIHIALTDHIAFLVRRCKMGIPIDNPFIYETESLYPKETEIAQHVIEMLNEQLSIQIPPNEIGFITLHIISSVTNTQISDIQKTNILIEKLIRVIEKQMNFTITRSTLVASRLITHLRFAIERVQRGEFMEVPSSMKEMMKKTYPECYSLSIKLITIMQNDLKKKINSSEAVYLSLHIYQLADTIKKNLC